MAEARGQIEGFEEAHGRSFSLWCTRSGGRAWRRGTSATGWNHRNRKVMIRERLAGEGGQHPAPRLETSAEVKRRNAAPAEKAHSDQIGDDDGKGSANGAAGRRRCCCWRRRHAVQLGKYAVKPGTS